MTTDNWQFLFNIAFAILLAAVGGGLGYILNQIKGEFARIDKRIDELRDSQTVSARDFRMDHNACKAALPDQFMPRREHETEMKALRTDITELKRDVREIYALLRETLGNQKQ